MNNIYIYVCETETAFNRLRAIAQRKVSEGLEYKLKGKHSIICNKRIDLKMFKKEDFTCFSVKEKRDSFGNIFYDKVTKEN